MYFSTSSLPFPPCVPLIFYDLPPSTFRSSSLVKLIVRVQYFEGRLYLLDGRFDQIHALCIDLAVISYPPEQQQAQLPNQDDLVNLKCFSLSCNEATHHFGDLILPLLYRMSNLEELDLYLKLSVARIFIDGNYLKNNIINRMSRLTL